MIATGSVAEIQRLLEEGSSLVGGSLVPRLQSREGGQILSASPH